MTDQLTDEAVKALLDGATPGPWRAVMGSRHVVDVFAGDRDVVSVYGSGVGFEYRDANARLIAAAPDLARALLDARADAQAAVALVLEQAGLAVANVEIGFHDGISGEWHPMAGPSIISAACAAIRALAPADGLAAVEALRKERDAFRRNQRETFEAMCTMRDAINEYIPMPSLESDLLQGPENSVFCTVVAQSVVAELAAAQQREAGLTDAVERLVVVLDRNDKKGPIPDVEMMFCWLAAQDIRAAFRAALSHNGRGE